MNLNLTDEEAFRILSEGKYNIIPIYCEVLADLESPMSAYMKLSLDAKSSTFLLESVEGGLHQARYSFIGIDPDDVLVQNGIDPLIEIERRMKGLSSYPVPDLPSFSGGTMGYISYDCIQYFEPTVKINNISTLEVPESVYMFFSTLVVFDHLRHSIKIVSNIDFTRRDFVTKSYQQCGISCDDDVSITQECVSKLYTLACERIQSILKKLSQPLSSSTAPSLPVFIDLHFERRTLIDESIPCGCKDKKDNGNGNGNDNVKNEKCECYTLVSNQGAEGYKGFVTSLKENIVKGDIIQAVPSHRLSRRVANNTTSIDIYRKLRLVNPSPYMFHINFIDNDVGNEKGFQIIGASPEQLVKVDEKRRVTTHPIAGTRRRGRTPEEDYALEKELLSNEKERAEHIMLVDLGRNDLGKISKTGSVKIDSFMHVERYSHVMHIVSHVSGQLKDTISTCDALRSVFPAGTVSGAPKVRAMQLVAELEQCKRDIYAGCVGYFSNTGVLDTAIAIRTMVMKDTMIHLQAGGGIVHDSSIQDEYDETINKMKGAEVAVIRAENANYYYHKQRKLESEKKE